MPLTPGAVLGQYVIRSLLGSGGMGDVYVAHDTRLDRDVALKLLPADLATDVERLRRFEQEARAASALNHPAIVTVYDFGHAESQPYISMELVAGQTLRQILQVESMTPLRALQIAAPVADGLAKAHDAGIVHRDLKPENLMVSTDGFVKILDFGLAKLVADAGTRAELATMTEKGTRPGSVMGTVGYMSPEQASGNATDHRSDQFAFGLVLYEMLAGRRAFSRPTAVETLSAIIRDELAPIRDLNPSVPAPIQWILDRCLAKNPADRYGSTRDLAHDLSRARDHFSELTSAGAAAPSSSAARPRFRRRELVAWLLVATGTLATATLVVQRQMGTSTDRVATVRFSVAAPENITFDSGLGTSPFAVSPEGQRLVYAGLSADGRRGLWIHSFDSLVSRSLAGTEGAFGPFWSPDGLSVGFFAQNRLKRITIASGEVATICEARTGGGAAWNRDGVIVFAPGLESPILRVVASGGTPTPVTTLDSANDETGHIAPVLFPDGRHFFYWTVGRDGPVSYVSSLDSPGRRRLAIEGFVLGLVLPDSIFFKRDRTLMAQRLDLDRLTLVGDPIRVAESVDQLGPAVAFSASPGGTLTYWAGSRNITQPTWFDRSGTLAGILGAPAPYMNVALSPDGRQLAVDRFDDEPAIWILDAARGGVIRATFGESQYFISTPLWSPAADGFVFAMARDSVPNLFLQRLGSTAEAERLFRSPYQSFPQSWSQDGRFVTFVTIEPKTRGDIWLSPMTGDRTPTPVLNSPADERHARISPDGRWMAYVSNDSGRNEVYVTRFPTPDGKWAISTNGGSFPMWSRNARELFYRARDGTMTAVTVGSGGDPSPGTPIALFKPTAAIGAYGVGSFYDVAPDGRFLINIFVSRTSPPATVVLNWRHGR